MHLEKGQSEPGITGDNQVLPLNILFKSGKGQNIRKTMTTMREMLDRLGGNPANEEHLSLLIDQFATRSGVLPFVGAGMSKPFGFPEWGEFLRELAKLAGIEKNTNDRLEVSEYEEAASDLLTALGPRRFQDRLAARFGDEVIGRRHIDGPVAQLTRLPAGPLITTNFDRVLEFAFERAGRRLSAFWHSQASKGSQALQQDRPFLLKLHGDWTDQDTRVLTLDEYSKAYGLNGDHVDFGRPIPALLYTLLSSRCCLFLGCSLKQDRTVRFLKLAAFGLPDVVHYAVVEEPETREELQRRAAELSVQGIRPIWYPHTRHDLLQPLLSFLSTGASERLCQRASELLSSFETPEDPPNNIPVPGNATVGRSAELHQVVDMLRGSQLVTISGVGGCGKSRLAVEVASASKARYESGIWFVQLADLAAKADKERIVPTRIGKVVGVPEQAGFPPNEALAEHLKKGKFLIVLDNCEHLIDSCRETAEYLLKNCPELVILTTSRRLLRLPQERLLPLAPLSTPRPGATDFEEIRSNESVRLFVERAIQRMPAYELVPDNAPQVSALCRALEGIPLAIELAAARLSVMSVEQMNREAGHLLTTIGNLKSGDLRAWKTLTSALRWSYGLLSRHEQAFMRSLAVFDGGWTEQAAEAVYCRRSSDDASVSDHLLSLYDSSLVVVADVNRAKRFRFLEPIRQMAQLQWSPEERMDCERRHAQYFLEIAEQAAPELLKAGQAEWLDTLQRDTDNFRAAIRWAVFTGNAEIGLRLIAALWRFIEIRGGLEEGRARARDVLGIPGSDAFVRHRAQVVSGAGMLAYREADFDAAEQLFLESQRLEDASGNPPGIANALNDLGNVARMMGDYGRARQLYSRSLTIEETSCNSRGIAVTNFNLGCVELSSGEYQAAERHFEASLRGFRDSGNERESGFPLNGLSIVCLAAGNVTEAENYARQSLAARTKVKDAKGLADTLATLGWIGIEKGQYTEAEKNLSESLSRAQGLLDRRGVSEALELFALLCSRRDQASRAIALFAAAEHIRGKFSYSPPLLRVMQRQLGLDRARASVTEHEYARAWRRGSGISTKEAIELAEERAGAARQ